MKIDRGAQRQQSLRLHRPRSILLKNRPSSDTIDPALRHDLSLGASSDKAITTRITVLPPVFPRSYDGQHFTLVSHASRPSL